VAPERLGDYLRDLQGLYDRYGYAGSLYGHFGDGCVHTRTDFDLTSPDGIERFRSFVEEAAALVLSHGGSMSGEHGSGQSRAELLPMMFGDELIEAFREFKTIWDPDGRMNPGKIVDPYRLDDNLRLGAHHRPWEPRTHFAYVTDEGSFGRAVQRCVGVGKCRKTDTGIMCPSYMVTGEEKHSTRGRAHLLWEMLQGDPIDGRWRSAEVAEALDLCLACKGCLSECPVDVDMATYKAEFYAHHFARRLRPLAHYSMGLLPYWVRLFERTPALVNLATQTRGLGGLTSRLGGLTPERPLPAVAPQSFRAWFGQREAPATDGPRVILWPDTFTNTFDPGVGRAATEVLEHLGYRVELPASRLCCGLPMITFGLLGPARRQLRRTVRALADDVSAGVHVVGLEPSCTTVFRHELGHLFPHDQDARRLGQQTVTLAELLSRHEGELPEVGGRALVQGHCHQLSVLGMDADLELMERVGVDAELLDSGCCGQAGSFGFEKGHHDVSMACGERVLFPAVRSAAEGTRLLADGFSCRNQIRDGTGRRAVHLAEELADALRRDGPGRQG
jgi:Fe-S oxidoreductase